jgi:hypothetical protein
MMTAQTDTHQDLAEQVVRAARVLPAFDAMAPALIGDSLGVPELPDLDDLPSIPDTAAGSPEGVERGTGEIEQVLDALVPEIEQQRRRLIAATTAKGFMTTAADRQRAAEVLRLLDHASRILAERA